MRAVLEVQIARMCSWCLPKRVCERENGVWSVEWEWGECVTGLCCRSCCWRTELAAVSLCLLSRAACVTRLCSTPLHLSNSLQLFPVQCTKASSGKASFHVITNLHGYLCSATAMARVESPIHHPLLLKTHQAKPSRSSFTFRRTAAAACHSIAQQRCTDIQYTLRILYSLHIPLRKCVPFWQSLRCVPVWHWPHHSCVSHNQQISSQRVSRVLHLLRCTAACDAMRCAATLSLLFHPPSFTLLHVMHM